jgi:hypothetical protein
MVWWAGARRASGLHARGSSRFSFLWELSIPFRGYLHDPVFIRKLGGDNMAKSFIKFGLAAAMMVATAIPAMARSFDVCITPATDEATQDAFTKGAFVTAAANIYAGGTIPTGGVTTCSTITKPVIGTFYANVGVEAGGLPAAPDVLAFVTWHFDFTPKGTFVTVGPIPFPPVDGGPATYPQTLAGASGSFPNSGTATVTNLSSDGNQFRIKLADSDHMDH